MSGGFRRVSERTVFEGFLITVAQGTFAGPDGTTFDRDVVHHPGAVSVVPITDDGHVVMVSQYRAALDADLLEIPAGKRDVPGEDPAITAHRELAEEVGYEAGSLELLARFYNSPGFCDEHSFVYAARNLTEVSSEAHGVEEQHMTVHRIPLTDVPEMITDGRIRDAKSIIGLAQVLLRDQLGGAT